MGEKMAEGRMLKRQISRSKKLAELQTDSARLLYTWIIPHLDIKGRLEADPQLVKGEIVPRLTTFNLQNIQEYLEDMHDVGLIRLYIYEGDQYLELVKFSDHQNLREEKEGKSHIPSPDNSGTTPGVLQDNSGTTPAQAKASKEKLREVKAREVRSTPGVDEKEQKTASCLSDNSEKPAQDETPYTPPDQDTISTAESPMIEKLIDEIYVELLRGGIMGMNDIVRFKKNCNGANRRAVLHTLCQCYAQKPNNSGGFCRNVLKEESPKYFAMEAERESEMHKGSREEASDVLSKIQGATKGIEP